ncbi:MAG: hypothetical protein JMDDDDMK_00519 [Acidobacteria bacterium]|nr:hypothetical protein [Acidobacteriota bacterium]
MDGFTIKTTLALGVLALIVFLWLVWKFFFKLFKHVVIMLLIGGAGSAFYYYRSLPPPPPAFVGKHAYMKDNGVYIGVVEGQSDDSRRGPVWIIRPAGGYPQRYAKSRVTLKDKMELKPEQSPSPKPEAKPAATKAPESKSVAAKVEKGKSAAKAGKGKSAAKAEKGKSAAKADKKKN